MLYEAERRAFVYNDGVITEASKKEQELLRKMDILNYEDLLSYLPRRYEDFSLTPKEKVFRFAPGEKGVFFGRLSTPVKSYRFPRISKSTFYFRCSYGFDLSIVAWNRPYLGKVLTMDQDYTLQVSYDEKAHAYNLLSIQKGAVGETLVPVYSLPKEFPEHRFVRLISLALEKDIHETIPSFLLEKYQLPHRKQALTYLHTPQNGEELHQGLRYAKYEEALSFCLRNQILKRHSRVMKPSVKVLPDEKAIASFQESLPFQLTSDQQTAFREILSDMKSPYSMNRLLQGDVGTGKTLVAGMAIYANFTRYRQSALMAPTEALAKQHEATFRKLFQGKLRVEGLYGSTPSSKRKEILSAVEEGAVDLLVGTHALFSGDVYYPNLGLVVIDEQHKFGVSQRARLLGKGEEADLLSMSATPIPRTLALTLYGDMDVSTLEVFPAAKRDVETLWVPPKSKTIRPAIEEALAGGGQIYAVAPLIEGSEEEGFLSVKKLYEGFLKAYPDDTILLHGRMSPEEKEVALEQFVSGKKRILVSTSLIEVGIDVPKACLLLVYEASRFSLSSLHQLRGRIGRDGRKALCLLISSPEEEGAKKLEILTQTSDGFEISKADLSLRGFGELSGTKQSGLVDLRFASIVDDYKMFVYATKDAVYILDHSRDPENAYFLSLTKVSMPSHGLN